MLDWLHLPTGELVQEVFALHNQPADLTEDLRARAAWYQDDTLFNGRGWRKFWHLTRTVRRVCAERKPDLVICWPAGVACWIAIAVRLAGGWRARLLVHCGNPPTRGSKADWISRAVLWPVGWLGGRCVCCSDYVRDEFRHIPGLPAGWFHTIYNCARTEAVRSRANVARTSAKPSANLGIMVATFEAHKDHATLLRALPTVLSRRPDFRLRLVGDGSLRPQMMALGAQLGLDGAVEFLGSRRDVPEWLGRSDLFIFSTTLQEGLGSVLIEALAAGLPIVASDVPACRETLANGEYGLLVPPADVSALAEGILSALEQPVSTAAERLAYASRFTPRAMVQQYLALFRV